MSLVKNWIGCGFLLLLIGCGSAENTPEEALETVRTAFKEDRWDLLYDVLPQAKQASFDQQVASSDQQFRAVAQQIGAAKASEQLKREFGFTLSDWEGMNSKERFSAIFQRDAKMKLAHLGVNPEYVEGGTIKSTSIRGDEATIQLDDGRGHRPRLKFKLEGNRWRFDIGGE
ncbi:MAG: hypothetical protein V2A76_07230 [Planctomycetota bacterium]